MPGLNLTAVEWFFLSLALILSAILLALVCVRRGVTIKQVGAFNTFGIGFVYGPQMLAVSVAWWNFRIDWKGDFRKGWPATRPIRKGEIPKGALRDFTRARGADTSWKRVNKDKYFSKYFYGERRNGWLQKLLRWLRSSGTT